MRCQYFPKITPIISRSKIFLNKFNYKAYRYIKLSNLEEAPALSDVTGYLVRTDYSGNSSFECSDSDMNAIWKITQDTTYALNDPIWNEVFEVKGYLQSISKSHLRTITTSWSRDMSIGSCIYLVIEINTIKTNNFSTFIQHMNQVVIVVPRRLLKCVSVTALWIL